MAIGDTISALNCIVPCDTMRTLSDAQFLSVLIDRLVTASGVDIADITGPDLATAADDALCDLQDRVPFYNASPETLKAVALYLLSEV